MSTENGNHPNNSNNPSNSRQKSMFAAAKEKADFVDAVSSDLTTADKAVVVTLYRDDETGRTDITYSAIGFDCLYEILGVLEELKFSISVNSDLVVDDISNSTGNRPGNGTDTKEKRK